MAKLALERRWQVCEASYTPFLFSARANDGKTFAFSLLFSTSFFLLSAVCILDLNFITEVVNFLLLHQAIVHETSFFQE